MRKGDYILVALKVQQVGEKTVQASFMGGGGVCEVPISEVLKVQGPCMRGPKHILAVSASRNLTTAILLVGREIRKTFQTRITEPFVLARALQDMVENPQRTVLVIRFSKQGEKVLEALREEGVNGVLQALPPPPPQINQFLSCIELAVRSGELRILGLDYSRFEDLGAKDIGAALQEYYAENPMPRVEKKDCGCEDGKTTNQGSPNTGKAA